MTDNLTYLIGQRIKELRKSKKFTQDKFAELIDIDAKHLSRIECAKTPPSLNLLKKISAALEVDISEFFKTQHLKSKEELIKEIKDMLDNFDIEKVKLFYKIIKSIEL